MISVSQSVTLWLSKDSQRKWKPMVLVTTPSLTEAQFNRLRGQTDAKRKIEAEIQRVVKESGYVGLSFLDPSIIRNNPFDGTIEVEVMLRPQDSALIRTPLELGGYYPKYGREVSKTSAKAWQTVFNNDKWDLHRSFFSFDFVEEHDAYHAINCHNRAEGHSKSDVNIVAKFALSYKRTSLEANVHFLEFDNNDFVNMRTNKQKLESVLNATERSTYPPKLSAKVNPLFRLFYNSTDISPEMKRAWLDTYDNINEGDTAPLRRFCSIYTHSPRVGDFKLKHSMLSLLSPGPLHMQLDMLHDCPDKAVPFLTDLWNMTPDNTTTSELIKRLDATALNKGTSDLVKGLHSPWTEQVKTYQFNAQGRSWMGLQGRYVIKLLEYAWNHYYDNEDVKSITIKPKFYFEPFDFCGFTKNRI